MRYFIDTEFIERFHKPLFGKSRHVIDLISIGIIAEDGREYYAVSNEYNANDASKWVKDNVIIPMFKDIVPDEAMDEMYFNLDAGISWNDFHKEFGKSNKQIANEIIEFIYQPANVLSWRFQIAELYPRDIEFYGYYSDYDWVLFCSLFGTMMQLPEGFPKYCRDLKQMLDEKVLSNYKSSMKGYGFDKCLEHLKAKEHFPQQINEHNALADAKWNMQLFQFLNSF